MQTRDLDLVVGAPGAVDTAAVAAMVLALAERESRTTQPALLDDVLLEPVVGALATGRTLGAHPAEDATARVAHIDGLVVLGDGDGRHRGRLRVVLAVVGRVHGQLALEH